MALLDLCPAVLWWTSPHYVTCRMLLLAGPARGWLFCPSNTSDPQITAPASVKLCVFPCHHRQDMPVPIFSLIWDPANGQA